MYLLFVALFSYLTKIIFTSNNYNYFYVNNFFSKILSGLIFTIPVYLFYKRYFKIAKLSFKRLFIYILGLLCFCLFVYIFTISFWNLKLNFGFDKWIQANSWLYLFRFLAAVFIAPISEELIFRSISIEFLIEKGIKPILIILFTSLLFGLLHFPSGNDMITTFILGLLLALVYFKERNILYCIILHALYNLSTFFTIWEPLN